MKYFKFIPILTCSLLACLISNAQMLRVDENWMDEGRYTYFRPFLVSKEFKFLENFSSYERTDESGQTEFIFRDADFGILDSLKLPPGIVDIFLIDIEVDPMGRFIAYGRSHNTIGQTQSLILRYDTSGKLDTTFGVNGAYLAAPQPNNNEQTIDVYSTLEGYFAVVRTSAVTSAYSSIIKLGLDGIPDSTFGVNGRLVEPTLGTLFQILHVSEENDIYILHEYTMTPVYDLTVSHLHSEGDLDTLYPYISIQSNASLIYSPEKRFISKTYDNNGGISFRAYGLDGHQIMDYGDHGVLKIEEDIYPFESSITKLASDGRILIYSIPNTQQNVKINIVDAYGNADSRTLASGYGEIPWPGHAFLEAGANVIYVTFELELVGDRIILLSKNLQRPFSNLSAADESITMYHTSVVTDFYENEDFSIFPNPNNGEIWVALETEGDAVIAFEMYNLLGQKVQQLGIHQSQASGLKEFYFPISPEIPAGVYLIKPLVNGQALPAKKFILNRR